MENLIYILLLIIHNIALVGCAAAPFYNLRLVNQRAQFGPKVFYELDKVVEDTIQGLEPYCWAFIILLFVTGFGHRRAATWSQAWGARSRSFLWNAIGGQRKGESTLRDQPFFGYTPVPL